ncbi:hypothetical protein AYI70_g11868 [Smittium culicis]|uniref:Reverse transcriptase domain-containing protein n=1 Tax=Smittium culicis TaxID=133412 RepID=A0A1R1WZZ9_9FUNG|nr:hypothetical protein AYI70_g11868 [Smittium culicis]
MNLFYLYNSQNENLVIFYFCRKSTLYFAKVDIKKAFESINSSVLIKIVEELIPEDTFILRKYTKLTPVMGKLVPDYKWFTVMSGKDIV